MTVSLAPDSPRKVKVTTDIIFNEGRRKKKVHCFPKNIPPHLALNCRCWEQELSLAGYEFQRLSCMFSFPAVTAQAQIVPLELCMEEQLMTSRGTFYIYIFWVFPCASSLLLELTLPSGNSIMARTTRSI